MPAEQYIDRSVKMSHDVVTLGMLAKLELSTTIWQPFDES